MHDDARSTDDLPAELAALAARLRSEAATLGDSYSQATTVVAAQGGRQIRRSRLRWLKRSGWAAAAAVCGLAVYLPLGELDNHPAAPGGLRPAEVASSLTSPAGAGAVPAAAGPAEAEITPAGLRGFSGAEREAVLDLLEDEHAHAELSI